MNKKIISVLLCMGLVFSAAGCGGQTGGSSSANADKPEETAVSEEDQSEEVSEDDAANVEVGAAEADEAGADGAGMTGAEDAAAAEVIEEAADQAATAGLASDAGTEEFDLVYAFASARQDGNNLVVVPNGTVNDDTVLYNEKTLGALCDYIDNTVLEDGRTINRKFLQGLVSVQVIDPKLMTSYEQFRTIMTYCLTIANEFYSMDVTVNDLLLDLTDNTKQVFEVTAEGKDDSWVLDGHEKKFYLNGGNTEYTSTMFDAETMNVWSFVLDQYFEVSEE